MIDFIGTWQPSTNSATMHFWTGTVRTACGQYNKWVPMPALPDENCPVCKRCKLVVAGGHNKLYHSEEAGRFANE